MLSLTGYRLVLWNGATDMRLSFNGLSGLVVNEMKEDPFQYGTLYVFFNQRRTQA
ncbi:IS66 family insertion sequence element accessory protein TnpB, partial [Flavitalea flava]